MDIAPPLTSPGSANPHVKPGVPPKPTSPLPPPPQHSHAAGGAEPEPAAEFLAIDDLLDFSDDDIGGPIDSSAGCDSNASSSSLSALSSELQIETPPAPPPPEKQLLSHQNPPPGFDSSALCVPCDDLAELEWLSNFVEESFSSDSAPACLAWSSLGGSAAAVADKNDETFRTTSPVSVLESNAFQRKLPLPPASSSSPDTLLVRGRARSKRCRTAVCFWNSRILSPEPSESLLESSSTAATYAPIQAASSESNMFDMFYDYNEDEGGGGGGIHRKLKHSPAPKMKNSPNGRPKKWKSADDAAAPSRKCLHCGTLKTPQWRAGPMGPKTLCNACGVRYKSGRLCDEYRPAASPTFVESVHSNSHRKVLEMRRQRGVMSGVEGQKQRDDAHRLRIAEPARKDMDADDIGNCDRDHKDLVSREGE